MLSWPWHGSLRPSIAPARHLRADTGGHIRSGRYQRHCPLRRLGAGAGGHAHGRLYLVDHSDHDGANNEHLPQLRQWRRGERRDARAQQVLCAGRRHLNRRGGAAMPWHARAVTLRARCRGGLCSFGLCEDWWGLQGLSHSLRFSRHPLCGPPLSAAVCRLRLADAMLQECGSHAFLRPTMRKRAILGRERAAVARPGLAQ
mmetsp:Transcript_60214/g.175965  ORF Transcript_60214/g.175965 Transcript_60214/m.175965 type:complete len:201 (-) Transcript_60214:301-903(-)